MKLHKTLPSILTALLSFTVANTALANTYIDFGFNDSTSFVNESGQRQQVNIKQADQFGWKKYSQFLGEGERWIWTQDGNEVVYLFNETTQKSEKLVNFTDPVGSTYVFKLGACAIGGTLAEKGLQLETAAGTLQDVVHMSFNSKCADGGTMDAWFAPKFGVVKWSSQSIAGPVTYSLSDGKVAGRGFGAAALQTALRASASFPKNYVVIRNNQTEFAGASLELTNSSYQDMVLRFNSGQEFEISLLDSNRQVLNTWSANIRFVQGEHDVTLAAGQSHSFGGVIALRNLNGQPLRTGQYRLRIEMKGAQMMAAGASIQTSVSSEAPIYIVRTN